MYSSSNKNETRHMTQYAMTQVLTGHVVTHKEAQVARILGLFMISYIISFEASNDPNC